MAAKNGNLLKGELEFLKTSIESLYGGYAVGKNLKNHIENAISQAPTENTQKTGSGQAPKSPDQAQPPGSGDAALQPGNPSPQ